MLRRLAVILAVLLAAAATSVPGRAQSWPQRPITLVHGFAAGGNADSISRLLANAMSESLGVPIIVDAKAGAGGNIASEAVTRAAPDGQTLILLTGGHAVSAALYRQLKYEPVDGFAFVSLVGTFPFVIATRADSAMTDLAALIASAKQQPGKLTFSSVGFGSTQHLAGELFALSAGIKMTHVPYRGGMQPLTDVLSGQIDVIVDTITVTGGPVRAGTLRGLGVTSLQPWPSLPAVPPVAVVLPGFEVKSWIGIAAPAATPVQVVARLNEVLRKALAEPAMRERLDQLGVRAQSSTPEEMHDFVAAEIKRWNGVIDRAGLARID